MNLVTHNNRFHADDVFACAILLALYPNAKITRTRDKNLIDSADIVFDVGDIYDESKNRFDHHQSEGAGIRENGIPYASCGLIWKHFGQQLVDSPEAFEIIDKDLIQPIDAHDNGLDIFKVLENMPGPVLIQNFLYSLMPTWTEEQDFDKGFFEAVEISKKILERSIKNTTDQIKAKEVIKKRYLETEDKRVITFGKGEYFSDGDIGSVLMEFNEPLIFIKYSEENNHWKAKTVRKTKNSFEGRIYFPESWAGLRDQDLQKITGVSDAVFCHRGRFLVIAETLEGIDALVKIALE